MLDKAAPDAFKNFFMHRKKLDFIIKLAFTTKMHQCSISALNLLVKLLEKADIEIINQILGYRLQQLFFNKILIMFKALRNNDIFVQSNMQKFYRKCCEIFLLILQNNIVEAEAFCKLILESDKSGLEKLCLLGIFGEPKNGLYIGCVVFLKKDLANKNLQKQKYFYVGKNASFMDHLKNKETKKWIKDQRGKFVSKFYPRYSCSIV